jgi:hypothetical protein
VYHYHLYFFKGQTLGVYTVWQPPLSGVHSGIMEKLTQDGEWGWGGARPTPCTIVSITCKVAAPAVWADTLISTNIRMYSVDRLTKTMIFDKSIKCNQSLFQLFDEKFTSELFLFYENFFMKANFQDHYCKLWQIYCPSLTGENF